MTSAGAITPYADLDELLVELLEHWQRILRDDLVGAHLQGSFALGGGDQQSDCDWLVATRDLVSVDHIGRPWLFNHHGHRTLEWDDHCNRGCTRWMLREHGITLTGPAPRSLIAAVPADLATWIDIDAPAWGQRYAVVTACRIYCTLHTAEVATKAGRAGMGAAHSSPALAAASRPGPRRARSRMGPRPSTKPGRS